MEQSPGTAKPAWYLQPHVILTVLISVLAVAFVGLLVLLLFVLPWSSEIVRHMQGKMLGVRSARYDVSLAFDGDDGSGFALHAEGTAAKGADGLLRDRGTFDLSIAGDADYAFRGERLREGASETVRFDELPERIGAARFGRYGNRWLRVWREPVRALLDLPLVGADRRPMSSDDAAEMAVRVQSTQFFDVEERLPNDVVAGTVTYRYRVRSDAENVLFRDLYERVESARLGRPLNAKELAASRTFFAALDVTSAELWIGRADRLLYRASFAARYDGVDRDGAVTASVTLSEHGRAQVPPLDPDAASRAEDVTPIITTLLAGLQGHLPLAKDGAVAQVGTGGGDAGLPVSGGLTGESDRDADGLPDALEGFYLTDLANPDSDGDGVRDGDEVLDGCNPNGSGWIFEFGVTTDTSACP